MKNIYKIIGLMSLSLLMVSHLQAQNDWGITEEQKAETLKVPFTEANQEAGQGVFDKTCKVCHKGITIVPTNDRKLPVAPNLGSQEIQSANTDGELFWRITNGHITTGMPPFGKSLSEDDRWKVVAYLRTFYPDYQPPTIAGTAPAGPPAEKFEGSIKSIKLTLDTAKKSITAKLTAVDTEGNPTNAKNVKVNIYVKRRFGSLLLGSIKSDENSEAAVICPPDIPADTSGMITISAAVEDSSAYTSMQAQYGEKLMWKNPLDENHLWGTSAKSPLWLKITYLSVVLVVWLTIFWAALQLVRIYGLRER